MIDVPPHDRTKQPGRRASLVLAILVHLLLAALLIYGVHWRTEIANVVEVDLIKQVPVPPSPAPVKPELEPEPKPVPKPESQPDPKPVKPDIVLKEKPKTKAPPKPKVDPFERLMAEEEKRMVAQRQIAIEERRIRQQREELAASQIAAARSKALDSYIDRIRGKIRGNIMLPPDIKGNPSAIFEVVQLPSGEVISARLVKPSGHPGYDAAVERAILKSSPLPRPDDPSVFDRTLKLTFCPIESGKCS